MVETSSRVPLARCLTGYNYGEHILRHKLCCDSDRVQVFSNHGTEKELLKMSTFSFLRRKGTLEGSAEVCVVTCSLSACTNTVEEQETRYVLLITCEGVGVAQGVDNTPHPHNPHRRCLHLSISHADRALSPDSYSITTNVSVVTRCSL
ncbi:hypothetical protein J6590_066966 [Homalodisca vitripennis]|nr:hypothetical protein J6590_066966 [Homalodisca vitripennis]